MSHRPAAALLVPSLIWALSAAPAAAQAPITEAEVRTLAVRQVQALNAGELAAYFATFAPQARFAQQALGSDNRIVPYGASTREEARAQLAKALAGTAIRETLDVRKVVISADGRGAALSAAVRTELTSGGRTRRSCAERLATFARVGGRLRALGQTDTLVRCRTAP